MGNVRYSLTAAKPSGLKPLYGAGRAAGSLLEKRFETNNSDMAGIARKI
jgi:hypothetical protein